MKRSWLWIPGPALSRRPGMTACGFIPATRYNESQMPPILSNKSSAPSVFQPAALLREARRQKNVPAAEVPAVCILDPDGDIVRRLRAEGRARPFDWPCYHTQLDTFALAGET